MTEEHATDCDLSDAAGHWLTFIEVKDETAHLTGWSTERVLEWLCRQGRTGEIPVRCLAWHLPALHPERRDNTRGFYDHKDSAKYQPEHDFTNISGWLKSQPKAMHEEWLRTNSEWRQKEFQTLVERYAAANGKSRKGKGGPTLNDVWLRVMVEVGAWLDGEGDADPADVVAFMNRRFAARRYEEPSASHANERANLALDTWRCWQRDR